MKTISIRELGRIIGVDEKLIRNAIKNELISKKSYRINPNNGRPEIYKDRALDDCRVNGIGLKKGIVINETFGKEPDKKKGEVKKQEPVKTDQPQSGVISIAEAKRRTAVHESNLKAMEVAERQKILVQRDKVFKELFEFGQQIKSSLQSIPDKYLDSIYSAKDRAEANTILTDAIYEALESLANVNDLKI